MNKLLPVDAAEHALMDLCSLPNAAAKTARLCCRDYQGDYVNDGTCANCGCVFSEHEIARHIEVGDVAK